MVTNLTGRAVLARMRRGDLPTLKGGYSNKSVFADGAVASHAVMHRLHRAGSIIPPAHTSVTSPWTLAPRPSYREWAARRGLRPTVHRHGKDVVAFEDTLEACPICGRHGRQAEEEAK